MSFHLLCKSILTLRSILMNMYIHIKNFYISLKKWIILRSGRTKFLNRDRGQPAWAEIPNEEKRGNSAVDWKACTKIEEYLLLNSNQPFISAITPNLPSPQIIIQHIHQHHHTNPIEPAHIPAKVKRQIERDYSKRLREELVREHYHHSI